MSTMHAANAVLRERKQQRIRSLHEHTRRGVPIAEAAAAIGVGLQTAYRYNPQERIDNTLLREAFQRSRLTAAQVALELDWTVRHRGKTYGDGHRLHRALGIALDYGGSSRVRGAKHRRRISVDTAECIADIIGVAAWEVGC